MKKSNIQKVIIQRDPLRVKFLKGGANIIVHPSFSKNSFFFFLLDAIKNNYDDVQKILIILINVLGLIVYFLVLS